jgi:hypothetical protein
MIVTPLKTAAGPKTAMNFVEGRMYNVEAPVAKRLEQYGLAVPVERDAIPAGLIVDDLPTIANVPSNLKAEDIGPTVPHDVNQNELVESVIALREEVAVLKSQLGKK